jgi:hypothetical protein
MGFPAEVIRREFYTKRFIFGVFITEMIRKERQK